MGKLETVGSRSAVPLSVQLERGGRTRLGSKANLRRESGKPQRWRNPPAAPDITYAERME